MRWLISFFLAVTLAAPVLAQDSTTPDISGTWKLNLAKSKPPNPLPSGSQTLTIVCSGDTVQFQFTISGETENKEYATDGLQHDHQVIRDRRLVSEAYWTPSTLETEDLVFSEVDGQRLVDRKDSWKVSTDGRTLTRESHDSQTVSIYERKARGSRQCLPFRPPVEHIFGRDPGDPGVQGPPSEPLVKHAFSVTFDFDFRKTPACGAGPVIGCVNGFVVYDISAGENHRLRLFEIPLPPKPEGVVQGITVTSPPLDFRTGNRQIEVVAREFGDTESSTAAYTTWIYIAPPPSALVLHTW